MDGNWTLQEHTQFGCSRGGLDEYQVLAADSRVSGLYWRAAEAPRLGCNLMAGVFDLTKPSDHLEKLRREFRRLDDSPFDVDHAFNFFVTAEHMLDWIHSGTAGRAHRDALRNGEPLLQLVSHIASGAKHFDRLSPRHQSMTGSSTSGGYFPHGWFSRNWFARGYFAEASIQISLSGPVAQTLGCSTISAVDLARHVLSYWSATGRVPN
jgi:hypothetical protein